MWKRYYISRAFFGGIFVQLIFASHSVPVVYWGDNCRKCEPGLGAIQICNRTHDTQCMQCIANTYSPRFSYEPCIPCSVCGQGFFMQRQCTATTNTKCSSCFHVKSHRQINQDFAIKCDKLIRKRTAKAANTTDKSFSRKEGEGAEKFRDEDKLRWVGSGDSAEEFIEIQEKRDSTVNDSWKLTVDTDVLSSSGDQQDDIYGSGREPGLTDNGSGDAPILTNDKKKKKLNPSTVPVAVNTSTDLGIQLLEKKDGKNDGGFQWPLLLAAVIAAITFFVAGFAVSAYCRRKNRGHSKTSRYTDPSKEAAKPFLNSAHPAQQAAPATEEKQHLVPTDEIVKSSAAQFEAGSPEATDCEPTGYHQSLRENHQNLRYIDESEDEDLMRSLGCPSRVDNPDAKYQSHTLPRRKKPRDDSDIWAPGDKTTDGLPPPKPPRSFSYRGPPKAWHGQLRYKDTDNTDKSPGSDKNAEIDFECKYPTDSTNSSIIDKSTSENDLANKKATQLPKGNNSHASSSEPVCLELSKTSHLDKPLQDRAPDIDILQNNLPLHCSKDNYTEVAAILADKAIKEALAQLRMEAPQSESSSS